jgi:hypothetical protein
METKKIKGFTVRDYFAAQAIPIVIRLHEDWNGGDIPYVDENGDDMGNEAGDCGTWFPHTRFFAESCYVIADEMMKARTRHENK